MQVIITGTVQADGRLILDEEIVNLPAGRVTITIASENVTGTSKRPIDEPEEYHNDINPYRSRPDDVE